MTYKINVECSVTSSHWPRHDANSETGMRRGNISHTRFTSLSQNPVQSPFLCQRPIHLPSLPFRSPSPCKNIVYLHFTESWTPTHLFPPYTLYAYTVSTPTPSSLSSKSVDSTTLMTRQLLPARDHTSILQIVLRHRLLIWEAKPRTRNTDKKLY